MLHCPPVPTSSWKLCIDRPQFAVCLGSSSVFDSVLLRLVPSLRQCLRHQVQHKPDTGNMRCMLCSATCVGVAELIAHITTSHPASSHLLCKVCGKLFKQLPYLKQHAVMHAKPRYQCHKCGRSFHWRAMHISHVKTCAHRQLINQGMSGKLFYPT